MLTVIAGEALLMQSRGSAIEFFVAWLVFELFVRFHQEARLTRSFPEEFSLYRHHVRRWIPRLTPWEGSGG